MKPTIKIFTFLFFFSMTLFTSHAQQKHFIYIQSDDKQPFAVVLDGKVYSSSDYGYVIVPKLTDGTYNFSVSFPMNKYPEQSFKCVINKKDLGYRLQNTEDSGWALQNMQTQKVVMNSNAEVAANAAFSSMLSEVVSDSNLTKKNTVSQDAPADNENKLAKDAAAAGIIASAASDSTASGYITDSIAQLEKIAESKVDTGTHMTFVDKTATGTDTINVFVPTETSNNNNSVDVPDNNNQGIEVSEQNASPSGEQKKSPTDATGDLAKEGSLVVAGAAVANENNDTGNNKEANTQNENIAFADTATHPVANPFYKPEQENVASNATANNSVASQTEDQTSVKPQVTNIVKDDCTEMISDNDFDKMKRKMFVQNNTNDMIQVAVKFLHKRCIMTEQVKTLGSLLSSDDGRYSLFDALYNNVYDYGRYPILESQILDPYYRKRFETMLR